MFKDCFALSMQELGIKHPLHKKKLQLALQALGSEEDDNKGKLDYHWVTSKEWMFIQPQYQICC